jgi:hypothetical protein
MNIIKSEIFVRLPSKGIRRNSMPLIIHKIAKRNADLSLKYLNRTRNPTNSKTDYYIINRY